MKEANVTVYRCDNTDRLYHRDGDAVAVSESPEDLPEGWLEVYGAGHKPDQELTYCSFDCAMAHLHTLSKAREESAA